MNLGGQEYGRRDIERRVGNLSQLGRTVHFEHTSGAAKGTRGVAFHTGSGFDFTVVPDRGMDISSCAYRGTNLVYHTPNGVVHPAFYREQGNEWLRTFFAGLLTTCGLTYFGPPGKDGEVELGLHGRYSAIPATTVSDTSGWVDDDYVLEVRGIVEECVLFGPKIRLTRTISANVGARRLRLHDVVENFGFEPSPLTILYHVNAGFPLLDDGAEIRVPHESVEPEDAESQRGMADRCAVTAPVPGFREHNFLYRVAADAHGRGVAAVVNSRLEDGLGLYVSFDATSLPYLNVWKMMGEGEYVVGIEPCNTRLVNRGELRERGELPLLQPGHRQEMRLEMGVLVGGDELSRISG